MARRRTWPRQKSHGHGTVVVRRVPSDREGSGPVYLYLAGTTLSMALFDDGVDVNRANTQLTDLLLFHYSDWDA